MGLEVAYLRAHNVGEQVVGHAACAQAEQFGAEPIFAQHRLHNAVVEQSVGTGGHTASRFYSHTPSSFAVELSNALAHGIYGLGRSSGFELAG